MLKNNSLGLDSAIGREAHCAPASVVVRDGHHLGTLFSWTGDGWIVVDLENRNYVGDHSRLAVVSLVASAEDSLGFIAADRGLNQCCLACDFEVPGGEWVVDASDLDSLRDTYKDNLEVLWAQD